MSSKSHLGKDLWLYSIEKIDIFPKYEHYALKKSQQSVFILSVGILQSWSGKDEKEKKISWSDCDHMTLSGIKLITLLGWDNLI